MPAGSEVRGTTVAPAAEISPSERGAPLPAAAQSCSTRSGATLTFMSGLVTTERPSPLMLATIDDGATPAPADAGVVSITTTMGGRTGGGLASSTARLTAATLAKAAKPRQNASCAPPAHR